MVSTLILITVLLHVVQGDVGPTSLFDNLGVTYTTTHTAYLVFKIPLTPLLDTSQKALDCLDDYKQHHDDAGYLIPVKQNILRLIRLINYVLIRQIPPRDNINYIATTPDPLQASASIGDINVPTSRSTTQVPVTYPTLVINTNRPPRRGKRRRIGRAVPIIEGLIAVSKLSVELLNAFKSTKKQADMDTLKYRIQRNSQALQIIQSRLDTTIANYKTIANMQSELVNITVAHEHQIRILQIATHTSQLLNTIYNALIKLQNRQLPLELVTPDGLDLAFKELSKTLGNFNLKPLHDKRSLYQQKVDAVYSDVDGLKILIPVVAAATDDMLQLYYVSTPPIQITNATLAKVELEGPYIAVKGEFEAEGQIFTDQQFADCDRIGTDQYSCPKTNYVFRNLSSTCIYNFLLGDLSEIKRTCSLTFLKETNLVSQHEGNNFTVYSTAPDTLTLSCETEANSAVHVFENKISFVLNRDCHYAYTTHHKFYYSSALLHSHEVVSDPINTAESILEPLKINISPMADYLPALGPIPIDEFDKLSKPKLFLRIVNRMIYPYTTVIVLLSCLYVICHVICIVKDKCSCKIPTRSLPYHKQMQRVLQ